MIGMLQIITYLLCVYLVVKGIEILQIGLTGHPGSRPIGITIGVISLLMCIGAAMFFRSFIDQQAESTSRKTDSTYSTP